MERVFPDYYEDFRCIAEKCQHNCCIGWEIDIDDSTAECYRRAGGEIGRRLRDHVVWDDPPHFCLGEDERCPFLNKRNRCDVIEALGEEALCDICRLHPRFCNELPERIEWGLGLCCEEAARRILGQRTPMKLVLHGNREHPDEIIALRDHVLSVLQDRSMPLGMRIRHMREIMGYRPLNLDDRRLAELLLSLERLDDSWTDTVCLLQEPMD
ncbi:MAG: flagellin lysine-N-methylase, partial [Clostridia bacterium]|nr:flagellin lysine-N-methylase [Clostridia bacterium]